MTPKIWLIIFLGNYEMPDFYINHVPFWVNKSRTYFHNQFEVSDYWIEECKKWHDIEGIQEVPTYYEEDYD